MGESEKPDEDDRTFGPMILSYSRAQAIDDGVLVDLTALVPDICRRYFKFPVAMTDTAFGIVQRAVEAEGSGNDYRGVIGDILFMTIKRGKSVDESTRLVDVIITGAGPTDLYTFKVVCGPGDDAAPVITIMLPGED